MTLASLCVQLVEYPDFPDTPHPCNQPADAYIHQTPTGHLFKPVAPSQSVEEARAALFRLAAPQGDWRGRYANAITALIEAVRREQHGGS